jgi:hypothetical protein
MGRKLSKSPLEELGKPSRYRLLVGLFDLEVDEVALSRPDAGVEGVGEAPVSLLLGRQSCRWKSERTSTPATQAPPSYTR